LDKLNFAAERHELRKLPDYSNCHFDFVSNDYLGIARRRFSDVKIERFSGLGSRLIAGNSIQAQQTEEYLSKIFQCEAALIFNSGYDANLGFFSTIPQKDEIVLYDQAIHASIRDGMRLSCALNYAFRHNDLDDLRQKLIRFEGKNIFIVVEGVYSMDGDQAPLVEIMNFAREFDAFVVVDEAHSVGILGENGLGLAQQFANSSNLLARIVTFGKAVGAHGAAVLTNREIGSYLVHACRSFIYTTALPPESYLRIEDCFKYLMTSNRERMELETITSYFAEVFDKPKRHIQVIPIQGISELKILTQKAMKEKIAMKGVWSPTVAPGHERLRISLHAFNTKEEILLLHEFLRRYGYV
jgi:8-amino-7-oxononanoate synthase